MSADQIVAAIVADLSDRGGIGSEWDQIDPETKASIIDCWTKIVTANLPKPARIASALGAVLTNLGEYTSHRDVCPTGSMITHDADDQAIADAACTCGLAAIERDANALLQLLHPDGATT